MKTLILTVTLVLAGVAAGQAQNLPLYGFPSTTLPSLALPSYSVPSYPAIVPPVYGTHTQIGNFGFYQDSLGTTGFDQQIGNFHFSQYQNGGQTTHCTANKIGNFTYSNCQ